MFVFGAHVKNILWEVTIWVLMNQKWRSREVNSKIRHWKCFNYHLYSIIDKYIYILQGKGDGIIPCVWYHIYGI